MNTMTINDWIDQDLTYHNATADDLALALEWLLSYETNNKAVAEQLYAAATLLAKTANKMQAQEIRARKVMVSA
jgi:hypothetical protein